jgi:hypothetical protein
MAVIDEDPLFVDAVAGDFRLSAGSPCIDAGHNWASAALSAVDLGGRARFTDDPATPDAGCGSPVVVDMGAYESPGHADAIVLGDVDADGTVGVTDLLLLLAEWGPCPGACCPADLDPDGGVGVDDVLILVARWGAGRPAS